MDYKARALPTREALKHLEADYAEHPGSEFIELTLLLLNASNVLREAIYAPMQHDHDLSEGKFILLMALSEKPEGMLAGQLAARVGVSFATISVMLKRMSSAEQPLITIERLPGDARSRLIKLSQAGADLIDQVLPDHFKAMSEFKKRLTSEDAQQLLSILRKLQD